MSGRGSKRFSLVSNWLARWIGSHWAAVIATALALLSLVLWGIDGTSIAISIITLIVVLILQNTQHRDSAALHLKLDEIITHLEGPRDELAGSESKSDDEIDELREVKVDRP